MQLFRLYRVRLLSKMTVFGANSFEFSAYFQKRNCMWRHDRIILFRVRVLHQPVLRSLFESKYLGVTFMLIEPLQLPQFFQVVYSASPLKSGVLLLPLIVVQSIVSFVSGFVVSKTGNYTVCIWGGFAIWAIACGLFSTISSSTSLAKIVGYQVLSAFGSGQTLQTGLIAMQANVERKDMAVVTATRNFLRLLGGTVALAACSAILNNTVRYRPPPSLDLLKS